MERGRVLELTTSPLSTAAVADVLSPQLIVGRHLLIVDSMIVTFDSSLLIWKSCTRRLSGDFQMESNPQGCQTYKY